MDRLREVIVHALVGGVAGCIGWAANGGRAVRGFFRRPWSHLMLLFMVLLVIVALFHNEPDSVSSGSVRICLQLLRTLKHCEGSF